MKPQLVEITWDDIASYPGWQEGEDDLHPCRCYSLGYITSQDKKVIRIAQTRSEDDAFGNVKVIPKVNVVKVRRLS
jgi:hypothetical protein